MSQFSSRGAEWEKLRRQVLDREPTCHWCGVAPSTEADHITPRAKGGEDVLENLVGSCKPCNAKRQDRVLHRTPYRSPRWFT